MNEKAIFLVHSKENLFLRINNNKSITITVQINNNKHHLKILPN